jgi:cobalamin synthase
MAKKQFGGITGDLAGFYVSTCETLVLVLCAILGAVF